MKEKQHEQQVGNISSYFRKTMRIMRLSLFFMVVSTAIAWSATTYSQSTKLSVNLRDATVKEVIEAIEEQSEFLFLYQEGQVDLNRRVSICAEGKQLQEILDEVFKGTDNIYIVSDRQVVIGKAPRKALEVQLSVLQKDLKTVIQQPQQKEITGKVTDSSGDPLPGATVMVKGTTIGIVTDVDGNFTLRIPANAQTLQVSFVGMKTQEIPIEGRTIINVIMEEDVQTLEELVVVGYGVQKKAHVTGSVAQIDSKELMVAPMTTISNLLTGKLPGLISKQTAGTPGADQATLLIRGFGTYNDSSPLLVVDGVPRNFNTLDPSDIESVTILKDAAAAAVYGVRAAHGVILVKTKRGKPDKKPTLNYTGSLTFSKNTRFPTFLNGPDYAIWHNKARELDGNEGYFSEEDLNKIINNDPEGIFGNTDWINAVFKDHGSINQHNLSVNGGSNNTQYFISGGFMDQEGIIPNSAFKRYNVRSNIDVKLNNEFKASLDLSGRYNKTRLPGVNIDTPHYGYSPITQAIRALPIIPEIYNELPTATGEGSRTYNPVAAANLSGFQDKKQYFFDSGATLEYDAPFLEGLSAKIFASYDHYHSANQSFLRPYYLSKFNPSTKKYTTVRADGTGEKAALTQSSSYTTGIMVRPSIEYKKTINKNNIEALFLYEYQEIKSNDHRAQRRGFLLEDIIEFNFAEEDIPNSIRGARSKTKVAGYVGRLNYNYDSKYLAEFAFRYDGSYKFHKDYRWGFFPSMSIGWMISEEDFWEDKLDNINRLKLRFSIGKLGKDNVSPFLYKRLFQITTNPFYGFGIPPTPSYALWSTNSVPSYDLTWEKTRTINGGIEMQGWNGLLNLEIDAFYKYTYDILQGTGGLYPPSISNNYRTIENSGSVSAKGFELIVGHNNTIGDFIYGINGNVSWARNKILKKTQPDNTPSWKNVIGKPIGGIYGFHALGLYQTEEQQINRPTGPGGVQRLGDLMYEDYNGDGKIDWYDQTRIARSAIPEMFFGATVNVQWKNFDLYAHFQGAALCDVIISGLYPDGTMDQTEFARAFYGGGNAPYYLVENSWTPENTNAKYPRLGELWNGNNGWTSDWWVINGSYLRLKQASLGYSIPKNIVSKIHAENLRIYISGTNLLTFDNLKYLDPEMPNNNNGYYPQQKTYSLGINLTF